VPHNEDTLLSDRPEAARVEISGEERHKRKFSDGSQGGGEIEQSCDFRNSEKWLSRLSKSSDFAGRSPVLAEPLVRPLIASFPIFLGLLYCLFRQALMTQGQLLGS
jgi:hypothetical protein